jgi:hypothetical protein
MFVERLRDALAGSQFLPPLFPGCGEVRFLVRRLLPIHVIVMGDGGERKWYERL